MSYGRHVLVRWLAIGLGILLTAGFLTVLPATSWLGRSAAAHASVPSGSTVYTIRNSTTDSVVLRNTSGTVTTLATLDAGSTMGHPVVSPDGSKVAFTVMACDIPSEGHACSSDPIGQSVVTAIVNTDGTGETELTFGTSTSQVADWFPTWSNDGNWIAYVRVNGASSDLGLWKIHPDGSGATQVAADTSASSDFDSLAWSPDGTKFAMDRPGSFGKMQLYYMSSDGTGATVIPSQPSQGTGDNTEPAWAPNSSRVYFQNLQSGMAEIEGINLDGSSLVQETAQAYGPQEPRVSPDGNTLVVSAGASYSDLFTVPTSGSQTQTTLTSDGTTYIHEWPSYVGATYPAASPSNSTVSLQAPTSHDAPYTRQISIGLSNSGVSKWQYGWSTSSSTAPNASYLQESTNVSGKAGTLNFLGIYSGSGTTWNGGTQPDADWYLWVRAYKTSGGAQAWGTPLKIHTPKAPVWVAVGDSYSSGHHQDVDEPFCPQSSDLGGWPNTAPPCSDPNAPYVYPNDYTFAWPGRVAGKFNLSTHAPSAWQITSANFAVSGAPTSQFGVPNLTAGSVGWASGQTQASLMASTLYGRYSSWNVVSMTGGADDTSWKTVMQNWYVNHLPLESYGPWAVPTANGTSDCPDSQSVYSALTSGSPTLNATIKTNLQGIVTVATAESPGVRILSVGYPDIVDSGNICYSDSGSWHGSHSVIGQLNTDHSTLTGSNVKYVDLTASGAFGSTPMSSSYLQNSRLYGYPHPSDSGQAQAATAVNSVATGSGW